MGGLLSKFRKGGGRGDAGRGEAGREVEVVEPVPVTARVEAPSVSAQPAPTDSERTEPGRQLSHSHSHGDFGERSESALSREHRSEPHLLETETAAPYKSDTLRSTRSEGGRRGLFKKSPSKSDTLSKSGASSKSGSGQLRGEERSSRTGTLTKGGTLKGLFKGSGSKSATLKSTKSSDSRSSDSLERRRGRDSSTEDVGGNFFTRLFRRSTRDKRRKKKENRRAKSEEKAELLDEGLPPAGTRDDQEVVLYSAEGQVSYITDSHVIYGRQAEDGAERPAVQNQQPPSETPLLDTIQFEAFESAAREPDVSSWQPHEREVRNLKEALTRSQELILEHQEKRREFLASKTIVTTGTRKEVTAYRRDDDLPNSSRDRLRQSAHEDVPSSDHWLLDRPISTSPPTHESLSQSVSLPAEPAPSILDPRGEPTSGRRTDDLDVSIPSQEVTEGELTQDGFEAVGLNVPLHAGFIMPPTLSRETPDLRAEPGRSNIRADLDDRRETEKDSFIADFMQAQYIISKTEDKSDGNVDITDEDQVRPESKTSVSRESSPADDTWEIVDQSTIPDEVTERNHLEQNDKDEDHKHTSKENAWERLQMDVTHEGLGVKYEGLGVKSEGLNVESEGQDVRHESLDLTYKDQDVTREGVDVIYKDQDVRREGVDVIYEDQDLRRDGVDVIYEGLDVKGDDLDLMREFEEKRKDFQDETWERVERRIGSAVEESSKLEQQVSQGDQIELGSDKADKQTTGIFDDEVQVQAGSKRTTRAVDIKFGWKDPSTLKDTPAMDQVHETDRMLSNTESSTEDEILTDVIPPENFQVKTPEDLAVAEPPQITSNERKSELDTKQDIEWTMDSHAVNENKLAEEGPRSTVTKFENITDENQLKNQETPKDTELLIHASIPVVGEQTQLSADFQAMDRECCPNLEMGEEKIKTDEQTDRRTFVQQFGDDQLSQYLGEDMSHEELQGETSSQTEATKERGNIPDIFVDYETIPDFNQSEESPEVTDILEDYSPRTDSPKLHTQPPTDQFQIHQVDTKTSEDHDLSLEEFTVLENADVEHEKEEPVVSDDFDASIHILQDKKTSELDETSGVRESLEELQQQDINAEDVTEVLEQIVDDESCNADAPLKTVSMTEDVTARIEELGAKQTSMSTESDVVLHSGISDESLTREGIQDDKMSPQSASFKGDGLSLDIDMESPVEDDNVSSIEAESQPLQDHGEELRNKTPVIDTDVLISWGDNTKGIDMSQYKEHNKTEERDAVEPWYEDFYDEDLRKDQKRPETQEYGEGHLWSLERAAADSEIDITEKKQENTIEKELNDLLDDEPTESCDQRSLPGEDQTRDGLEDSIVYTYDRPWSTGTEDVLVKDEDFTVVKQSSAEQAGEEEQLQEDDIPANLEVDQGTTLNEVPEHIHEVLPEEYDVEADKVSALNAQNMAMVSGLEDDIIMDIDRQHLVEDRTIESSVTHAITTEEEMVEEEGENKAAICAYQDKQTVETSLDELHPEDGDPASHQYLPGIENKEPKESALELESSDIPLIADGETDLVSSSNEHYIPRESVDPDQDDHNESEAVQDARVVLQVTPSIDHRDVPSDDDDKKALFDDTKEVHHVESKDRPQYTEDDESATVSSSHAVLQVTPSIDHRDVPSDDDDKGAQVDNAKESHHVESKDRPQYAEDDDNATVSSSNAVLQVTPSIDHRDVPIDDDDKKALFDDTKEMHHVESKDRPQYTEDDDNATVSSSHAILQVTPSIDHRDVPEFLNEYADINISQQCEAMDAEKESINVDRPISPDRGQKNALEDHQSEKDVIVDEDEVGVALNSRIDKDLATRDGKYRNMDQFAAEVDPQSTYDSEGSSDRILLGDEGQKALDINDQEQMTEIDDRSMVSSMNEDGTAVKFIPLSVPDDIRVADDLKTGTQSTETYQRDDRSQMSEVDDAAMGSSLPEGEVGHKVDQSDLVASKREAVVDEESEESRMNMTDKAFVDGDDVLTLDCAANEEREKICDNFDWMEDDLKAEVSYKDKPEGARSSSFEQIAEDYGTDMITSRNAQENTIESCDVPHITEEEETVQLSSQNEILCQNVTPENSDSPHIIMGDDIVQDTSQTEQELITERDATVKGNDQSFEAAEIHDSEEISTARPFEASMFDQQDCSDLDGIDVSLATETNDMPRYLEKDDESPIVCSMNEEGRTSDTKHFIPDEETYEEEMKDTLPSSYGLHIEYRSNNEIQPEILPEYILDKSSQPETKDDTGTDSETRNLDFLEAHEGFHHPGSGQEHSSKEPHIADSTVSDSTADQDDEVVKNPFEESDKPGLIRQSPIEVDECENIPVLQNEPQTQDILLAERDTGHTSTEPDKSFIDDEIRELEQLIENENRDDPDHETKIEVSTEARTEQQVEHGIVDITSRSDQLESRGQPPDRDWSRDDWEWDTLAPAAPPGDNKSRSLDSQLGGLAEKSDEAADQDAVTMVSDVLHGLRTDSVHVMQEFVWEHGGQSVSVAGSFSDWQDVPMTCSGGIFKLSAELPVGRHYYRYTVDGENLANPIEDMEGDLNVIEIRKF